MRVPSRFKESLGFIKDMRKETPFHTKQENDFDIKHLERLSALKMKSLLESLEDPTSKHNYILNDNSGFYHNLYAAFTLLDEIDYVLDEIEYLGISLTYAEELVESCSLLQVTSTNALMEIDEVFSFSKKYSLAQEIYNMAENMYNTMRFCHSVLSKDFPQEERVDVTKYDEVEWRLCCKYIRSRIAVLKLFHVLAVLQTSPIYSKSVHQIAEKLIQLLREILYNKRIIRMVVDTDTKGMNEKLHKTTRLKIYFTLGNTDRYCIRLDFPHEGEDSIHLNLNEPGNKQCSGFPFYGKAHTKALKICGNQTVFDSLFYNCDDLYWFRSDYANVLKGLRKTNEIQGKALEEFYHEQAHIKVSSSDREDKSAVTEFSEAFAEAMIDYENTDIYGRTDSDDSGLYRYILFQDCLFDMILWMKGEEFRKMIRNWDASAKEAFQAEVQPTMEDAVKNKISEYIYKKFPEDESLIHCVKTATGLCDLLAKCIDVLDQMKL